jgi:probable F420-dependent oxidoreductase
VVVPDARPNPSFGVMLNDVELLNRPELLRPYCETLAVCGVDSVWLGEHLAVVDQYRPGFPGARRTTMRLQADADRPDPFILLTWLASASTTLLLGTSVVLAPLHHPISLAKRAATLDVLSGGRLRLGLGVGWQQEEYAALGVPFEERGRRLDECLTALRQLWASGPSTFAGKYYRFENVHCRPGPVRSRIPIVLGGHSPAALARAAARADGWFPFAIDPDKFADAASRVRAGAENRSVEITAWPGSADPGAQWDAGYVAAFASAGANRIVIRPCWNDSDPLGGLADELRRFSATVLGRES